MAASGYPGFDGLIDAFANADREALYAFSAVLQGWLSQEHKADGSHGNVTVDTLGPAADPIDGAWLGNLTRSLVPTVDGVDLGATIYRTGNFQRDHPFRHLRLSGTLTWATFTDGGVVSATVLTRNGSLLTLTFPVGAIGDLLSIVGNGGTAKFTDLGTWSAPAISGTTVIAGASGFFERSRVTAVGEWTTFTPTRTASAGTWTAGAIVTARYMLVGKTLWISFEAVGTSVSNAGVELRVAIPGGFVAAQEQRTLIHVNDNAAGLAVGTVLVNATGTTFRIFATPANGTFAIAAATTDIYFLTAIEVQ